MSGRVPEAEASRVEPPSGLLPLLVSGVESREVRESLPNLLGEQSQLVGVGVWADYPSGVDELAEASAGAEEPDADLRVLVFADGLQSGGSFVNALLGNFRAKSV